MAVKMRVGPSNWIAKNCWARLWLIKLLMLTWAFLFSIEFMVGWDLSYWCSAAPERGESFNNCTRKPLVFPPACTAFAWERMFPYLRKHSWFCRRPDIFLRYAKKSREAVNKLSLPKQNCMSQGRACSYFHSTAGSFWKREITRMVCSESEGTLSMEAVMKLNTHPSDIQLS